MKIRVDKLGYIYPSMCNATEDIATYTLNDTTLHSYNITATHDGWMSLVYSTNNAVLDIMAGLRLSNKQFGGVTLSGKFSAYVTEPFISVPCKKGDSFSVIYQKTSGSNNAKLTVRHDYIS